MKTGELLVFWGIAAISHILFFLTTFEDTKEIANTMIGIISLIGSLLGIYLFWQKK
ncbi:MAG: hypothetical protein AAF518_26585 [Spirochaetota bacterium]